MSDLTRFRDHCRTMAKKTAPPDLDWALWTRLADEVDAYLARDPDVCQGCGGDPTDVPTAGLFEPVSHLAAVLSHDPHSEATR